MGSRFDTIPHPILWFCAGNGPVCSGKRGKSCRRDSLVRGLICPEPQALSRQGPGAQSRSGAVPRAVTQTTSESVLGSGIWRRIRYSATKNWHCYINYSHNIIANIFRFCVEYSPYETCRGAQSGRWRRACDSGDGGCHWICRFIEYAVTVGSLSMSDLAGGTYLGDFPLTSPSSQYSTCRPGAL